MTLAQIVPIHGDAYRASVEVRITILEAEAARQFVEADNLQHAAERTLARALELSRKLREMGDA